MSINPHRRGRGAMTGGAVIVLITSAALATTLVVVMGGGDAPPPAAVAGPAPGAPTSPEVQPGGPGPEVSGVPALPQDWQLLPSAPALAPQTPGGYPTPQADASESAGAPVRSPGPASSPATAYAFAGVAGSGCAQTARTGSYASYPAGQKVSVLAQGWRGAGCAGGTFWSVPMSGTVEQDTPGLSVTWWFDTDALTSGSCAFWVYVPKPGLDADAAGRPTHYQVVGGRDDDRLIGQFTVDQAAGRGTWVHAGVFRLDGGEIAVRMVNRGTGAQGARHAAAQIQAGCRP